MYKKFFGTAAVVAMTIASATYSYAATGTVNATDVVYAAGGNMTGAQITAAGGTTPNTVIAVGGATSVTITSATGTVTLASGNTNITANGTGGANPPASSSNTGFGFFSGLPTETGDGYLTGVFYGATPSGATPAAVGAGIGTTTSPLLNQTFVIGAGALTVNVPAGAVNLALGISDACGYAGAPSCYGDNSGSFTVTYTINNPVSTTPVPPSIWLTLIGLACGAMYLGFNGLRANSRA